MAALMTGAVELPRDIFPTIINKAKDTSTIGTLSPSQPAKFMENDALVFTPSAEAEVVEEGAQKSSYEQKLGSAKGKMVTFQTTTRVSQQLIWADEDDQLEIIKNITSDQADAAGRLLDYVVYHAVNPLPQTELSGFKKLSDTARQVTGTGDAAADLEALIDALNQVYDINGIALSRKFASDLRKVRIPANGARMYPDIPMNLAATSIEGVKAATSGTVDGVRAKAPTGVLAFAGDFSLIRWGMVRNLKAEIIQYGDPDGQGDLKRLNQVAYRTEGVLVYTVLDPEGLAVLKQGQSKRKGA